MDTTFPALAQRPPFDPFATSDDNQFTVNTKTFVTSEVPKVFDSVKPGDNLKREKPAAMFAPLCREGTERHAPALLSQAYPPLSGEPGPRPKYVILAKGC